MAHLSGSAGEIRARVPGVEATYDYIHANVLTSGLVDQELKDLCFRFLLGEVDPADHEGRERAALDWAYAIAWESERADDELWERLHALFSEPELVELGCSIGFELGQQHFVRTLGLEPVLPQASSSSG
jgi:alkylhydroperoxidase family enzyme